MELTAGRIGSPNKPEKSLQSLLMTRFKNIFSERGSQLMKHQ